jgi:hypothetical protein
MVRFTTRLVLFWWVLSRSDFGCELESYGLPGSGLGDGEDLLSCESCELAIVPTERNLSADLT